MNILEIIRKNSILVLIVIVGIGAGMLMMDYGNKGIFSDDLAFEVDGTSYSYPDVGVLGNNAESYIANLSSATFTKLREKFDADADEKLSAQEEEQMKKWLADNPGVDQHLAMLQHLLDMWSYGFSERAEINIALNRALIAAEAEALGIYPSLEQIDAYIKALPAFRKADGSFDDELYRKLCGYHNGLENSAQEKIFRSFIADMIVWGALEGMMTSGMTVNSQVQTDLFNQHLQQMFGKTAVIEAAKLPAPAEPTEAELKAYWEKNKGKYLTEEERVVSIYTLTPAKDVSMDELGSLAEYLLTGITQGGSNFDKMLADAAADPQNPAFTYLQADGKSYKTLPAFTQKNIPAELALKIGDKTLGDEVFQVLEVRSMADYKKAIETKSPLLTGIKQIRGFYPTNAQDKLILVRVDGVERPVELTFEAARSAARADLLAEREKTLLHDAGTKLLAEMQAELKKNGLDAAFALATKQGASVSDFGPINLDLSNSTPEGLNPFALAKLPLGTLSALDESATQARISSVVERNYIDSPELNTYKSFVLLPQASQQLRNNIMFDWLHAAYGKFQVQLSESLLATQRK